MNGVRKTIAVLIIIFIGIPVLIGIIWGVGLTRAVVSPEFLTEIPQDIIARVPTLLDETIEAVDREDVIRDEDTRIWVRALTKAETSPREFLEEIGIMDWLRNELSRSLKEIGRILRGEISPRPVVLNMRPLKAALTHEGIEKYLMEIMAELPPCTESQTNIWVEEAFNERPFEHETPPACRPPEMASAMKLLRQAWINEVDEIPDEVDMLQVDDWDFYPHRGIKITKAAVALTYFLFFVPALILLLAAVIATSSGPRILRWVGTPTLIGGGLAFLLSKFVGQAVQWGLDFGPVNYSYSEFNHVPFSEVGEIFIDKMGGIILTVVDHLFSAVNSVAGTVCIVGIILIAISYLIGRETHTSPKSENSGNGSKTDRGTPDKPAGSSPSQSPTDGKSSDNSNSGSIQAGSQTPQLPGKENDKALPSHDENKS